MGRCTCMPSQRRHVGTCWHPLVLCSAHTRLSAGIAQAQVVDSGRLCCMIRCTGCAALCAKHGAEALPCLRCVQSLQDGAQPCLAACLTRSTPTCACAGNGGRMGPRVRTPGPIWHAAQPHLCQPLQCRHRRRAAVCLRSRRVRAKARRCRADLLNCIENQNCSCASTHTAGHTHCGREQQARLPVAEPGARIEWWLPALCDEIATLVSGW